MSRRSGRGRVRSTGSCITRIADRNVCRRYSERLAEVGVVTSVGSRGDSYDNALADSVNGLYKTDLVRKERPWRGLEDFEFARLKWKDWYNHRRLFSALGSVPPAEYEATYYPVPILAEAGTR